MNENSISEKDSLVEDSTPGAERHPNAKFWADMSATLSQFLPYLPTPAIIALFIFSDPGAFSVLVGTLLVIAGFLWRLYTKAYLLEQEENLSSASSRYKHGPFKVVRGPLQMGNTVISLGVCIYAASLYGVVIIFPLAILYFYLDLYNEETERLAEDQTFYSEYKLNVPAIFPISRPGHLEFSKARHYEQGFTKEIPTYIKIGVLLLVMSLFG